MGTRTPQLKSLVCVVSLPPLEVIDDYFRSEMEAGVSEANAFVMAYSSRHTSLRAETADGAEVLVGGPYFDELETDWAWVEIDEGDRESAQAAAQRALSQWGADFFAGELNYPVLWQETVAAIDMELGPGLIETELRSLARRVVVEGDVVEVMLPGAPEWAIEKATPGLPRHVLTVGEYMRRHPESSASYFGQPESDDV